MDLQHIVEATAKCLWDDTPGDGGEWEDLPALMKHRVYEAILGPLTHAAPLIVEAVVADITREIDAMIATGEERRERRIAESKPALVERINVSLETLRSARRVVEAQAK